MPNPKLYYVADPMCSWCYGFGPALEGLEARFLPEVALQLVMGGLAPDNHEPMDASTRAYVQEAWRAVAARTGVHFEHRFWELCAPRRSTWPACRAVLTAEEAQAGAGRRMYAAIQRAYYLEARNPSELETLTELAGELGLDSEAFGERIDSQAMHRRLAEDLQLRDALGVRGYPSLVLEAAGRRTPLTRGWVSPAELIALAERHSLLQS